MLSRTGQIRARRCKPPCCGKSDCAGPRSACRGVELEARRDKKRTKASPTRPRRARDPRREVKGIILQQFPQRVIQAAADAVVAQDTGWYPTGEYHPGRRKRTRSRCASACDRTPRCTPSCRRSRRSRSCCVRGSGPRRRARIAPECLLRSSLPATSSTFPSTDTTLFLYRSMRSFEASRMPGPVGVLEPRARRERNVLELGEVGFKAVENYARKTLASFHDSPRTVQECQIVGLPKRRRNLRIPPSQRS
jgi:hypothetical protein